MDARLFDRRTIKTPLDQFVAGICREAGVRYRGIQSGFANAGVRANLVVRDF